MATEVTITGSGTPMLVPGRAGPGVVVRHGEVVLQFDAGRATTLRLAEAGVDLTELAAVFLTHHHSDHVVGLADLLMTRWLEDTARRGQAPLAVFVPEGPATTLAEGLLEPWADEIELRAAHPARRDRPHPDVRSFAVGEAPITVFAAGAVRVMAVGVHHEPVIPAVAYRVDTPDGAVVISGDTTVCAEVEALASGAAVVVHEAFRTAALTPGMLSDPAVLAAYHADAAGVGSLAARAGVATLVLTHLIPPPRTPEEEAGFTADVRRGGFEGDVVVATDLTRVVVGG